MKHIQVKKALCLGIIVLCITGLAFAQVGEEKKRPLLQDYGKVILDNYSRNAGLAPVEFDHWLHRALFTCRVCHVDIAFEMKTGTTGIKAADNIKGYYCGTCHNGKMTVTSKKVFTACALVVSEGEKSRCERCHSSGIDQVMKEYEFSVFTKDFPRERFGNGIDWEKAELDGRIRPIDYIEGVSIKTKILNPPLDISLDPKNVIMPEIIFSHRKHTVWNGCEMCHPDIFIGVEKGKTKYTMEEIISNKYCGACHNSVAFPLLDCQRCHVKPAS